MESKSFLCFFRCSIEFPTIVRSEVDFLYPKEACLFLHFFGGIEWIDVY